MPENVRAGTIGITVRTTGGGRLAGAWRSSASSGGTARQRRLPRPSRLRVALLALTVVVLVANTAVFCSVRGSGPAHPVWQDPAAGRPSPTSPTLRSLAPSNLRIGSAVNPSALTADPDYPSLLASEFNAVTAENAMKWWYLQPTPDSYDWSASDQLVEFARANGQAVYGHTLVWHSSIPSWVSESWSTEEIRALLKKHITTVASRYRGKIWAWDVVNEALAEDGSLRDSLWLRKLGPGYVADAFRWAHEADPDARLFINDYGTEGRGKKADALLALVRNLRAAGVPVDGVGFQSHLQWDETPQDLAGNLRRFAELGVSVAITELDVRIKLPATVDKLRRQAATYEQLLRACLAVSACVSFTVWGFTDARSWIPANYQGYGSACLFDVGNNPKPAHTALIAALRQRNHKQPG